MKKPTLSQLEAHLWEAAHIITGPIDASDYKTYIFPILFFKRVCDVYDEEYAEALELFEGDWEMAIACLVEVSEIRDNHHNLSIPLYVHNGSANDDQNLESVIEAWQSGRVELKK